MEEIVISKEAMDVLAAYDWPGNVRELRNAIRYATRPVQGNPGRSPIIYLPASRRNGP